MIHRVHKIKGFGVFDDFSWSPGTPDFKQFNLIYGWNYSGKTTLSRAFRCFEQKQPHPDFPAAQVQLRGSNGVIHHLHTPQNAPVFRVFNSDFVHQNINFDSAGATPILVLGAADIAKQETLKANRAEREAALKSKGSNEKMRAEKTMAIERALTKDARDLIKNPLGVPGYDKRDFERNVAKCNTNPEQYLLDDEALAQNLAVFRSTEKKPALALKALSLSPITEAKEKATELLARVVTINEPITRLKEDPVVETWVKEGRPLHEKKTECQFCGQPLPTDLLTRLAEHFSADYENLMAEAVRLEAQLNATREQEIALDSKSDFYPELQARFVTEKGKLDKALKTRTTAFQNLAKAVANKQTKAFTNLVYCP